MDANEQASITGDPAMRRNPLRDLLNAGKPTVGTHILSAWPTLVELIGHSKQYDYVEFTAEYAPFTMHDLDNLGRSFELMGMSGMIKIEQTQYTHQAMRAIGSGFQSVLFADIRSVEDAPRRRWPRACAAAVASASACAATSARSAPADRRPMSML
jgi:2-keto-3-deoxy-L-rhamnonate aldolase RhmA